MPAVSSCPIALPAGIDHLDPGAVTSSALSLLRALRGLPDPRARRGVRYNFCGIVTLAVMAMLTGARGYAAIWRWSAQALPEIRAAVGLSSGSMPSEKTIRVILQNIDPTALATVVATWLAAHLQHLGDLRHGLTDTWDQACASATSRELPVPAPVTVIAVDGKTVRGSRTPDQPGTHLLAAFDTTHGIVLDQVGVNTKSNEITHLPTLLHRLRDRELLGTDSARLSVVTADAMHTQRDTAAAIVAAGAEYVLTVKKNHPKLHAHLVGLPWQQMPTADSSYDRGHGRLEERHTIIATVTDNAGGIDFPHAEQVLRIVRRRRNLRDETDRRRDSIEIVYVITSIPPGRLTDDALAGIIRTHWGVENRLHYIRDTAFDEDRCRARTGNGAAVLAGLRNLAITVLRLLGTTNIRAALEHHAYDRTRPLQTLQRLS